MGSLRRYQSCLQRYAERAAVPLQPCVKLMDIAEFDVSKAGRDDDSLTRRLSIRFVKSSWGVSDSFFLRLLVPTWMTVETDGFWSSSRGSSESISWMATLVGEGFIPPCCLTPGFGRRRLCCLAGWLKTTRARLGGHSSGRWWLKVGWLITTRIF